METLRVEKGIYLKSNRFYVQVTKGSFIYYVGSNDTVGEAREARDKTTALIEAGLYEKKGSLANSSRKLHRWDPYRLVDDNRFGLNLKAMTIYNNNKSLALGSSGYNNPFGTVS